MVRIAIGVGFALGASACGALEGLGSPPEVVGDASDAGPRSLTLVVPDVTQVHVVRGATKSVDLTLMRSGGVDGEATVTVSPSLGGVTADPLVFQAGATSATLVLHASAAASLGIGTLDLQVASGLDATPNISLPLIIQDASGAMDVTFGTNGVTSVTIPNSVSTGLGGQGLVVQPDGRIVFCGDESVANNNYDLLLGRLTIDGHLDDQFAAYGIFTSLSYGYTQQVCEAVSVLASGGLAVGGFAARTPNHTMFAAKLTPSGILDPTFGRGTGFVAIEDGNLDAKANTMVVEPNGKLVLAGFQSTSGSIVRLTSSGGQDTVFDPAPTGTNTIGINTFTGGMFNTLSLLPGNALLGTVEDAGFRLERFTADGKLDLTYGVNGVAFAASPHPLWLGATAIVPQASGATVLVGWSAPRIEMVRFTADGQLDTTFGNGGVASTVVQAGSSSYATSAAALPDGRIAVSVGLNDQTIALGIAVFTADGALDTTFGKDGYTGVASPAAGGNEPIAVDSAGRIVIAAAAGANVTIARFWP